MCWDHVLWSTLPQNQFDWGDLFNARLSEEMDLNDPIFNAASAPPAEMACRAAKPLGGLRNAVDIKILIMWRLIAWRRNSHFASWSIYVCKTWSELTAHHKKNPTKDHINLIYKDVLVSQGWCSFPWIALQDHPFMQCFRTWEPWLLQMTALGKAPNGFCRNSEYHVAINFLESAERNMTWIYMVAYMIKIDLWESFHN
jgi:hypothetical protein